MFKHWISRLSCLPVFPMWRRLLSHKSNRRKYGLLVFLLLSLVSAGCGRTGLWVPDPASLPPRVVPPANNAYRAECSVRIPYDRITPLSRPLCPEDPSDSAFCRRSETRTVIFPPELNPNSLEMVAGAHPPTEAELQSDAAGRVSLIAQEGARLIYSDCRVQATCTPVTVDDGSGTRIIETFPEAKGNMTCPSVALTGLENLDRATFVSAPNRADCPLAMNTARVCRPPSFDPPTTPPDGFLGGIMGHHSTGEVASGTARVTLSGRPEVATPVRGSIELTGGPCPGASCNVGLAVNLRAVDINYGGDSVRNITIVGAGESPGASVNAAGVGTFAPGRFFFTIGATGTGMFLGRPVSDTQVYLIGNSDPIRLTVDWTRRAFTVDGLFRMVSGPADRPVPEISVRVNLEGRLTNTPPLASVESDKVVECMSTNTASFTLRGNGRDLDNDIISYIWRTDHLRPGRIIGDSPEVSWQQELGTQTYTFQVIDKSFQNSNASLRVTVRDTTPPTIIAPELQVPCGWGSTCDDPKDPKLCITLVGKAEDSCSKTTQMVIHSVQPFDGCSDRPLGPAVKGDCIRFDPRFSCRDISDVIYRMYYSARDESGNLSPNKTLEFKVQRGDDFSRCPAGCRKPRTIVMSPCGR